MFDREALARPANEVALDLLGATLSRDSEEGRVTIRLTEVEAYLGEMDPGSHAFRGLTKRTTVMFGEPGHLYTYFTYGMHVCANVVCSPPGTASAVLLRGGEVVEGLELARARRTTSRSDADLARGPARLVVALGVTLADGGADLATSPFDLTLPTVRADHDAGPRTGVSGEGGSAEYPWRFWIPGERTVSP
ncbi:DNA-3-methyladenine glycosylase [Lacisediminihabitans profunda]|uniref:Putative 3-methyladenine DNA glycosylase n=1 Tax=Lacisediminihabitans profunda TaxID=2594790 RepID=A0A5C8UUE2_9MICO|nr:DNA-3-methyladenine glycosylase [Lacisediminihabitans profunda]TXN31570.1 DNA-3-methyladenine glycosylase [Lacisediminihabitans profunda]